MTQPTTQEREDMENIQKPSLVERILLPLLVIGTAFFLISTMESEVVRPKKAAVNCVDTRLSLVVDWDNCPFAKTQESSRFVMVFGGSLCYQTGQVMPVRTGTISPDKDTTYFSSDGRIFHVNGKGNLEELAQKNQDGFCMAPQV